LVLIFLAVVVPTSAMAVRQKHPLVIGVTGLVLVALLVYAIFKLSDSWIRESLRSIVAAQGGGFVGRFQAGEEIATALGSIPGIEPGGDASEWRVPATAAAASALLQFAKRYDFDFVPQPRRAGEQLIRGG